MEMTYSAVALRAETEEADSIIVIGINNYNHRHLCVNKLLVLVKFLFGTLGAN